MTTLSAIDLPFDEAIAYLRQKTNVTSESYTDVWGAANVKSFTVAGATTDALVGDFRAEVAKALEQGTSLQEFRKGFDAIVEKHGWSHTGKPGWRSRVIYETNLGMAYSAGRYKQQTETETLAAFPYWQYVHSGALHPRLQHKAWNGLVLRADDPFWKTHYPPNGWFCGCRVRPLSARGLARQGKLGPDVAPTINMVEHTNRKTGEVIWVAEGIDPGFDYNPGQEWLGTAPKIPANATLTAKAKPSPSQSGAAAVAPPPAPPSSGKNVDDDLVQVLPPKAGPALVPIPKPAKSPPVTPPVKAPPSLPAAPASTPNQPAAIAVRRQKDLTAASKTLHSDYLKWGQKLEPDELTALRSYKGAGFAPMNGHLRGSYNIDSMMPSIRALDAALGRAKAKRPVTVYRGVRKGTAWDAAQIGDVVADAGFMSTTINPATASSFSGGGVVIEIRLPKGYTGGAYVHEIPTLHHQEYEFLLRPGAPFKVVSRTGSRVVLEPARGVRRRSPKLD